MYFKHSEVWPFWRRNGEGPFHTVVRPLLLNTWGSGPKRRSLASCLHQPRVLNPRALNPRATLQWGPPASCDEKCRRLRSRFDQNGACQLHVAFSLLSSYFSETHIYQTVTSTSVFLWSSAIISGGVSDESWSPFVRFWAFWPLSQAVVLHWEPRGLGPLLSWTTD